MEMVMSDDSSNHMTRLLKRFVRSLIDLSTFRFVVIFVLGAVLVSVLIVMSIDLLWDGRLNAELEFAGVVTPFLDGLFLIVFITAMIKEFREEVRQRKLAEEAARKLNEALEEKVRARTKELIAVQDELVRTEKLAVLGQVADAVGHELRNPLGVMNNAVYFLQTVLSDADETTREYLDIMKDEIEDADRIVSDLLDAVRTKPPHPEQVVVEALLRQTMGKCAVPTSISIQWAIPKTIAAVRVDPMHMHQVFWNLVTNAVEAMPDGGELEISANEDRAANTVTVKIKDSGIGIAPEHRINLFQPMFTTKVRRVGLGLVVVKNLILANDGSVAVESEPGKGSVFTVTLPGSQVASSDRTIDDLTDKNDRG
jgi:signal transduction histidine kinase